MYKLLILFCIFCNFFSYNILSFLVGEQFSWADDYGSREFVLQTEIELVILFTILLFMCVCVKSPLNLHKSQVPSNIKYEKGSLFYIISNIVFCFFLILKFSSINWNFSTEGRGVGQWDLENRETPLQGLLEFYLPFLIYLILIGFFRGRRYLIVIAIAVLIISGVSDGGRDAVVYFAILGFIYIYYFGNLSAKSYLLFFLIAFLGMTFSASDRFSGGTFIENTLVKIIGCNADSSYLTMVKYAVKNGITLSPLTFSFHFLSLLVPSYVFVAFFNMLSYPRASLLFNTVFNDNPDNGMGFMMLADFYWSFGYFGYILYLLFFYFVLSFFSKNIYSNKPVNVVLAMISVLYICNQRVDFGSFVKPFVYTYVFLSIFEHFRKKYLLKKN